MRIPLSFRSFWAVMLAVALVTTQAMAADRDRLRAFLTVTGFDVALESIKLSASQAPQMLGLQAEDFGAQWSLMTREVFDVKEMQSDAMQILSQTLSDEGLAHAAEFYATDLGQRLVEVENENQLKDQDDKVDVGGRLLAEIMENDPERLALLERMLDANGSEADSLRAFNERQIRFLMAAQQAGVIDRPIDIDALRAAQAEDAEKHIKSMRLYGLANSAATYRDFTNEEIAEYAAALEHPLMQEVYELMFAVQYEITADRFEEVASRMAKMSLGEDL